MSKNVIGITRNGVKEECKWDKPTPCPRHHWHEGANLATPAISVEELNTLKTNMTNVETVTLADYQQVYTGKELNVEDMCIYCGNDTGFGNGSFVNRIGATRSITDFSADLLDGTVKPDNMSKLKGINMTDYDTVDGWMCDECQYMECAKCDGKVYPDDEVKDEEYGETYHRECLPFDKWSEEDKEYAEEEGYEPDDTVFDSAYDENLELTNDEGFIIDEPETLKDLGVPEAETVTVYPANGYALVEVKTEGKTVIIDSKFVLKNNNHYMSLQQLKNILDENR